MAITAQSIIKQAQINLQDEAGIRWPAGELVAHLNDGQRDIALLRPDMLATVSALALTPGARQAVPANCAKLIEISRNTAGPAIRQVARGDLDMIEPNWYTRASATTIKHFTHDPREPGVFYVYPPAATGASVDVAYAALPADVPAPAGAAHSTVTGSIGVPDVFANALLHFVLFRAFAKDAETSNAGVSAAHYQLFKAALADDVTTRQAVKPTVTDNT